jgi:hypothetical protein
MRAGGSLEVGGVCWRLRAGEDPARLAPLCERALGGLARARDLRAGRRKRLFRLALAAGAAPDHLLKRSADPPLRGLLRMPGRSKARRELAIAEALAARGVPVVVPLAAGERRRAGRLRECFLLAPLLPGARDLGQLWRDPGLTARERRTLAAALGALLRDAHAAGLAQDDLAPNNVLVCGRGAELRLVDFERARLRWRLGVRARRRSLAKLARSASRVPASQRLRFLRAYAGSSAEARRWWRRLSAEAPRLARRDDTRLRRTATRDGRRFVRVAHGAWRGFARRGAQLGPALARLGPGAPSAGAARVEVDVPAWRVVYRRLPPWRARRLWAGALALAARGCAPPPLALLCDAERTLLVVEPPAGAKALGGGPCSAAERGAVARLLAELGAMGALRGGLAADALAIDRAADGRPRALLVAPHGFAFARRAGGRRSRAAARRLLAALP